MGEEKISKQNLIFVLTGLIEIFATVLRATEAMDLFVLDRELVVVRDFLSKSDGLLGIDDDLLLAVDSNDFCITIGLKKKRGQIR